jgi:hypothetical protein
MQSQKTIKKCRPTPLMQFKKTQFAKTHLQKNQGITLVAGHLQPMLKPICG